MVFYSKQSTYYGPKAYRDADTARGKCGFATGIPARRLDWGLGRERVYLEAESVSIEKIKVEGRNVLGECTSQCLLAANLLAANEGVHCHGNGTVNVLRRAVFGQAHFAEGLSDTHNRLKVADLR